MTSESRHETSSINDQIAVYKTEVRLLRQLLEVPGWQLLARTVIADVKAVRDAACRTPFPMSHQEHKLDGIQSIAFEAFQKGALSGLERVTQIPEAMIATAEDHIKILELKLAETRDDDGNSSSDDDAGSDDDDGRNAP